MTFIITKDFNFCYGHRVHNQVLDAILSENMPCKCRHLHGHEAKVSISLSSDTLKAGMVTDFNNLSWLKTFLDRHIDHKFVVDIVDPLRESMTHNCPLELIKLDDSSDFIVGHSLRIPDTVTNSAEYEYLESFFVVNFVPTSENFSEWLFNLVNEKMKSINVTVNSVEWWESSKSRSIYTG